VRLGLLLPLGACVLASVASASDASACGGCFIPPDTTGTVVTGHRMALSISPKQTVLWDQIQYSGDPKEFAWVLPVKPGAYIEVATDAWFETLEAATGVGVLQPRVTCHDPYEFGGCGSTSLESRSANFASGAEADDGSSSGSGGTGPQVDVIHRGTVGPYDTVTLGTDTPGALNAWLQMHSYNVDPATQPIIDAYVAEGFDFIAIRLLPDKGVREMKPVRVTAPGASPTLPLRMVAIGTGATVAVTLFVIGEGRWEAESFPNSQVPVDLVAWDFKTSTSNYPELRAQTLKAADGGTAWITTYAKARTLLSPAPAPNGAFGNVRYGVSPEGMPLLTIAETYLNQAILNGETKLESGDVDTASCVGTFSSFQIDVAESGSVVANPCPMGAPFDDPLCGSVDPSEVDARTLACGAASDLAVALTGLHPRDVWLTRLETDLPQAALKADLNITAAATQTTVENFIRARIAVNADALCESITPPNLWSTGRGGRGMLVGFGMAGLALAAAIVRRRAKLFA
jgi:hypothetical protein